MFYGLMDIFDQQQIVEFSFGICLCVVCEVKGLDLEVCGYVLKLLVCVLCQFEGGQYDGIDYQVYLGSYIIKYGCYLGLDDVLIQVEVLCIC